MLPVCLFFLFSRSDDALKIVAEASNKYRIIRSPDTLLVAKGPALVQGFRLGFRVVCVAPTTPTTQQRGTCLVSSSPQQPPRWQLIEGGAAHS
jgi:hypothetical protein